MWTATFSSFQKGFPAGLAEHAKSFGDRVRGTAYGVAAVQLPQIPGIVRTCRDRAHCLVASAGSR